VDAAGCPTASWARIQRGRPVPGSNVRAGTRSPSLPRFAGEGAWRPILRPAVTARQGCPQCRRTPCNSGYAIYIPDYHPESSGSWQDWYDGMIAEVKLAETLGFESAWFAEHRVPGFAFG
jgi:hypothetical protein